MIPNVGPNWRARWDPLRFFIHSVANHQNIEGGPFGGKKVFEKSRTLPKKPKGGTLFSLARYCMFREKKRKNHLVQFLFPTGTI